MKEDSDKKAKHGSLKLNVDHFFCFSVEMKNIFFSGRKMKDMGRW